MRFLITGTGDFLTWIRASVQRICYVLPFFVAGCGEAIYDEIELMPSPLAYSVAGINPFPTEDTANFTARSRLFYVTDRAVAGPEDDQAYYTNQRGQLSRAGIADVTLSPTVSNWQEFVDVTMRGIRDRKYLLNISDVTEIGVLPYSVSELYPDPPPKSELDAAGREFAKAINTQLLLSRNRDVHIYVHGYNVDFEYSTLVGRELQHFLGYQGAFITYNWAATPNRLAYFKDQETASASRRNLRSLIEFLSEHTKAERINLIGYSAGSRLAFEVMYQIALLNSAKVGPRLGKVILISSDLDRSYVGHSLADGILDSVDKLSIYTSGTDAALAISSFVFGRDRLGQKWEEDDGGVWPALEARLASLEKLEIIDVTDAEESSAGNGHAFFRTSPWASSDIFLSILTQRDARERGLVRSIGDAVWAFPPDYPERLKDLTKR